MTAPTTVPTAIPGFHGTVHTPGSPGYDRGRQAWNRAVDARPAMVAVATTVDDVASAVRFAAGHGLPLTVQATGHGTQTAVDGGVLLRTQRLDDVDVDPAHRTARIAAGTCWQDVVAAAAPHGLAPLSGVGSVGAIGFTVGGGAGPLARLHGLAADSVTAAEVVTADGERRRITTTDEPDLFWAIRGGGGSFAVVTAMEIRLFPVEWVRSGLLAYDVAAAPDLLGGLEAWAADAPDGTSVAAMLTTLPEAGPFPPPMLGRTVVGLRVTQVGDTATDAVLPLTEPLGEPLLDTTAWMTFAESYASAPPHEPTGVVQHFGFVESLTDGVSAEVIDAVTAGRITSAEIRQWGGALARPRPDGGAAGVLEAAFSVLLASEFADPGRREEAAAAMADTSTRLRPHETGRTFLNFVADPVDVPRAFASDTYDRLTAIKTAWDPADVIRPGIGIRRPA
jgi:FAD/FMN-containing dehydrogenase